MTICVTVDVLKQVHKIFHSYTVNKGSVESQYGPGHMIEKQSRTEFVCLAGALICLYVMSICSLINRG